MGIKRFKDRGIFRQCAATSSGLWVLCATLSAGIAVEAPQGPKQNYAIFSINVHDFAYPDLNIATLRRSLALHKEHQVPVDFYLTTTMMDILLAQAPDLWGANEEVPGRFRLLPCATPHTLLHPLRLAGAAKRNARETARDYFARHRESYWGRSDEGAAKQHLKNCEDALGLLFQAAAKPGGGKLRYRLPGVVDSFIQWCERTREDFQLGPQIEELLEQRKRKEEMTQTYGRWRAKQKEDPTVCRMMKFVDDPKKSDGESLTLELETVPLWRPGHPMRGVKG